MKRSSHNKQSKNEIHRLRFELEVEASLERVRVAAMTMSQPDDLSGIGKAIYKELKKLGLEYLRNTEVIINHQDKETITSYYCDYGVSGVIELDYRTNAIVKKWVADLRKSTDAFAPVTISKKEIKEWRAYRRKIGYPSDAKLSRANAVYYYSYSTGDGALSISTFNPINKNQRLLLKRFRNVFRLSYLRYLDIANAEALAKEAQIEAALERVRGSSMAMHRTSDMLEVVKVVIDQLQKLGVKVDFANFNYLGKEKDWTMWLASPGYVYPSLIHLPYIDHPLFTNPIKAIREGKPLMTDVLSFKEKNEAFRHFMKHTIAGNDSEERKKQMLECRGMARSIVFMDKIALTISNSDAVPYTEEANKILLRFGKAFEQAYTRFLDLQRAEAQAREAQIEASLERVRSSMMAMHESRALPEVMKMIMEQLINLNVHLDSVTFNTTESVRSKEVVMWTATKESSYPIKIVVPNFDHPIFRKGIQALEQNKDFFKVDLSAEETRIWWDHFINKSNLRQLIPEGRKNHLLNLRDYHAAFSVAKNSALSISSYSDYIFTTEENAILKRFGSVFEQSYTRFLDLQRAEEQAREATIETSLERVRSRTMAMHKSVELLEVIKVVAEQLEQLGFRFDNVSFAVNNQQQDYKFWLYAKGWPEPQHIEVPYLNHPITERVRNIQRDDLSLYNDSISVAENREWIQHLLKHADLKFLSEEVKNYLLNSSFTRTVAFMPGIMLIVGNYSPAPVSYTDEEYKIIKRFAAVFDQAYTRFQDLQKAEEQTREAQIEASLERVRGKAMAMHRSEDLSTTIEVFYRELEQLRVTPLRCGVGLLNKENRICELSAWSKIENEHIETIGKLALEGHPVLEGVYENWLTQTEYHPILRGNDIKVYNQLIRPLLNFPDTPDGAVQYGHFFYFPEGGVYAYTDQELAEEELKIYRRFTSVLSLTYKRYKDLRDAETRTQLAIREASLDRLRASITSMRTAEDLQRITPVIWKELKALGVPFFRCGVFIVDEPAQIIHFYLSTPDNRPLAALHLGFNDETIASLALESWRNQKPFIGHWTREEFVGFMQSMMKRGQISTAASYQGGEMPPESLTLQFVPFNQGMLYVGSSNPLTTDHMQTLKAIAEAFSTAYARYEDFTRLESAKAQVEKTLSELKQAQQQLVQSEKMASLGELTAGIAHEIQNPLNFVNNFSEVSGELIGEMKQALAGKNITEAIALAEDIKENLEKILHHGKRADGIVKNMLQHSRSSTGKKEPTDLNALADEYLRLAFHGLRAKDKSFNAKFETNLDPSVGKVHVIPQEIGRVLLNLINNAFYAVTEKQKLALDGYQPTVTVATLRQGDRVHVTVHDNGMGIPSKIQDKVFQPFFTTKPAGQGTGLGLSLSYDIVSKGHGGEMRLDTKEGESTTFIVSLPA